MNETHIGPVRITLRTFAPEEIRRQNDLVHDGTGGWEENVEGLILRIRASRHEGPLSSELLRNWATHPDERVRIALLRSNPITIQTQSRTHAREIASLIVETDARFRTTDETWNPVLDVLACAREDLWCLDSLTGKPQNVRATDQPQPDSPLAWIRSRVVPKLHERGLSLNEAKEIIAFTRYHPLLAAVLKLITPDLAFVRWLTEHRPDALPTLAVHPGIEADAALELWHTLLEACRAGNTPVPGVALFDSLRSRGMLPRDAFARLLEIASMPTYNRNVLKMLATLFWADELGPGDPRDLARRYYRVVRGYQEHVSNIVNHPKVDDDLCAHIAEDTPFDRIRAEIAVRYGTPLAIRDTLLRRGSADVLRILAGKSTGQELIGVLDRLAAMFPFAALQTLIRRIDANAVDASLWRETLSRYFEMLIDNDPAVALSYLKDVSERLEQGEMPIPWVRAIARSMARKEPATLYRLKQEHLDVLEAEDWLAALETPGDHGEIAKLLMRIPSATRHPRAREFIFQHGGSSVVTLLEIEPPRPGEERMAALAVIREAPWRFDYVLERYPPLKAALRPEDITALLASKHHQIRQNAICLLGEIGERSASQERPHGRPQLGQRQQG